MTLLVDLVGERFSRLTVIRRNGWNKHGHTTWDCKCDCGRSVPNVPKTSLVTGNTRSCGCIALELLKSRNKTHGKSKTPLYRRYAGIKDRCNNPTSTSYRLYGGRGIKCLWKSFGEFEKDMGSEFYRLRKEGRKISIERIDVNGDYCKENCKWAEDREQANNTRRNHFLEFNGERKTLTEWAREIGSKQERIRHRLKLGFSVEEALTFKKHQYRDV